MTTHNRGTPCGCPYVITIVAQGRMCLFGSVVDGEMRMNAAGKLVCWDWGGNFDWCLGGDSELPL